MKQFLYLLLIVFLAACEPAKTTAVATKDGAVVTAFNGFQANKYDLFEFEYKGHAYIACRVRDGIALTHAGHCPANHR